jgi:hypothetical protein
MTMAETLEDEARRMMKDNARSTGAVVDGVLVHNHIEHGPNTSQGVNGFRYGRESLHDDLEVCDCGWHTDMGTHYRVASIYRELGLT